MESIIKIVDLNGDDLVKDFSNEIEQMLGSKMKSVKVRTISCHWLVTCVHTGPQMLLASVAEVS